MSPWSMIAIACLVALAVSAGLALYYGIYANPIGTYASYVCYAMILFLTVIVIIAKKPDHHAVAAKKPKVTTKAVSTGAGTVQMASG